jgi:hypothetical protein
MAPYPVDACPLCAGNAVTVPVESARGKAYACNPCCGVFTRDPRLPPRPQPLPLIPPGVLTLPRLLPFVTCAARLVICTGLARHDARHGHDVALLMQCLCMIANAWMALGMAGGIWRNCRAWRDIRATCNGMLDNLETIALTHLRMLDAGIDTPEAIDHRFTEFADRFDERIRQAFRSRTINTTAAGFEE